MQLQGLLTTFQILSFPILLLFLYSCNSHFSPADITSIIFIIYIPVGWPVALHLVLLFAAHASLRLSRLNKIQFNQGGGSGLGKKNRIRGSIPQTKRDFLDNFKAFFFVFILLVSDVL